MNWKSIEINDINKMCESHYQQELDNDFHTFNVIAEFQWQDYHKTQWTIIEGCVVFKYLEDGKIKFGPPIGKKTNIEKAIKSLQKEFGQDIEFMFVEEEFKDLLEKNFDYKCIQNEDYFEYIYNLEKFKTFSGKKLQKHRNSINKLESEFEYEIIKYKPSMTKDLDIFFNKWIDAKENKEEAKEMVLYDKKIINNYDNLIELSGIVLKINKEIVGTCFYSYSSDLTIILHTKKSLHLNRGIEPAMVKWIANNDTHKYISMEEDYGSLPLREAKRRYRPDITRVRYDAKK